MFTPILFSDTPEHFYQQLRECIQQTIQKELSTVKKEDEEIYLKKHEVRPGRKYYRPRYFISQVQLQRSDGKVAGDFFFSPADTVPHAQRIKHK